jgi:O-antigen ligase
LRRLTLILLLVGAASAMIGILLWAMPDGSAETMLNRLGRVGYPVGGVLHYRQDSVALGVERAIGTWVEPNAYAGFLLIVGSLSGAQLFSRNPVTGWRWMAFAVFGVIGLAMFLSNSRGAALGLVAAVGLIGVLRDRRLIWLGVAGLIIAPFFPPTREFMDKIVAGLTASDLETQMRLGEYKDALTLINRYPVFGVGFTGVPDIDLYVAFSSTYLTIAANAGFVGLFAFLGVIGRVIGWGFRWWGEVKTDPLLSDVWLVLLAGIIGALIGGVFDHFYFNPQFQATSMILWSFIGFFLAATRIAWEREQ